MQEKQTLIVNKQDVTHYTPLVSSCVHPMKGRILFSRQDINKGTVIASLSMDDIKLYLLPNIQQYVQHLKSKNSIQDRKKCIEHSVPTGNGKMLVPNNITWNNYFSHSMDPNIFGDSQFYTKDNWDLIAIKDIKKGDELTKDYNQCVGYELRPNDKIMQKFLQICNEYGVEKRPSRLTLPPCKVRIRTSKL